MSGVEATVGVLALQGAFSEHIQLLRQAADALAKQGSSNAKWSFIEVRTPNELAKCDALILPGGESTTISLVAARSGLLEPLRHFVKLVPQNVLFYIAANSVKNATQTYLGNLCRAYSAGRVC